MDDCYRRSIDSRLECKFRESNIPVGAILGRTIGTDMSKEALLGTIILIGELMRGEAKMVFELQALECELAVIESNFRKGMSLWKRILWAILDGKSLVSKMVEVKSTKK